MTSRQLKKSTCILLLTAVALFSSSATKAVTIVTVPIGNPGNPADTRYDANGVGSVPYSFRMGKTEVTNSQYVEFLHAVAASDPYGLYNPSMASETHGGIVRDGIDGGYTYTVKEPAIGQGPGGSDYLYDDKPVVFVSLYSVLRFANWLHNGQMDGDTEDGAYTLLGGTPLPSNWHSVTRNPDARWRLPSVDEWYKAAYYDPVVQSYHEYPTGNDNAPNSSLPSSDTGNSANFSSDGSYSGIATGDFDYPMTDVGAYTLSYSSYGTLDQGGNVAEWNDTLFPGGTGAISRPRGGYWGIGVTSLSGSTSFFENPDRRPGWSGLGFRVATIVPEPGTLLLAACGLLSLLIRPQRRATP